MNPPPSSTIETARRALVAAGRLGGRRRLMVQLALSGLGTLIEVASLAALLPVVMIVVAPVQAPAWLPKLQGWVGVSTLRGLLLVLSVALLVLFVAKNVLQVLIVYLQHRYAFGLANTVARWTVERFLAGSFDELARQDTGRLWHQILIVPGEFAGAVTLSLFYLVGEIFVSALIALALALYDPRVFALLAVSIGPPAALAYGVVKNRLGRLGRQHGELVPEANRRILPILQDYLDIKLTLKARFFAGRLLEQVSRINQNQARAQTLQYIPYRLVETSVVLAILAIVAFQQLLAEDPGRLAVILGVYSTGAFRILPSLNRIVSSLMRIRNAEHVLELVEGEIKCRPAGEGLEAAVDPARFERKIAFERLSYRYPESPEPTLRDVVLDLPKGSCVGIMGPSGSGKTTLLRLILGLVRPQQGHIAVDDRPLMEGLGPWWQILGYVPQEVYILDGTLAENVAFGEPRIDQARLQRALDLAELGAFVHDLPFGLQTPMGAMGARLSGGQRQRIGIARALYRNAQVFLFDEITSALDHSTEADVLESIAHLKSEGRTIVIISHRESTLKHCDRVYTLDQGRLAVRSEAGSGIRTAGVAGNS